MCVYFNILILTNSACSLYSISYLNLFGPRNLSIRCKKKWFIPFPQLLYSPFISLISKRHVLSSCPRNASFVLICLCLSAQHQIITCYVIKSTGAITWLHFTYSRHFAENTSAASLIFHQSESERMQRDQCKTKETARQEVDVQFL